ncbi:unnamed protein product, partial [Staurois parvus]
EHPYPCSECGKCFSYKSRLYIYQRSYTGEKPYVCPECGKYFSVNLSLHTHQRSYTRRSCIPVRSAGNIFHHKREQPYSCSECGKCFTYKSRLYIYQRSYTGEKPYVCPECGKYFSVKPSLHTHQRSYMEEKLYTCSECGKCFFREALFFIYDRDLIWGKSRIGNKRGVRAAKVLRLIYCMEIELYVLNYMFKLRRGSPRGVLEENQKEDNVKQIKT